jgi:hypothetical protein
MSTSSGCSSLCVHESVLSLHGLYTYNTLVAGVHQPFTGSYPAIQRAERDTSLTPDVHQQLAFLGVRPNHTIILLEDTLICIK